MINDKSFKNNKAFTLQELLIVIAIIAILIAVTIQIFSASLEKSRRAVDMSNARNIVAALSVGYLSGAADSYNDYSDSTFESHANWWKSAASSNIEIAMGL